MGSGENIVIYGAGDLGRECLWLAQTVWGRRRVLGFIDDFLPAGKTVSGLPVLGGWEYLGRRPEKVAVVCAIADPAAKRLAVQRLCAFDFISFPALVHPSAVVSDSAAIMEGAIVGPGCVVSVDARVGRHAVLCMNCAVGHDASIGDFALLSPGCSLGGHVQVGEGAALGVGSSVKPGVKIGEYATLGAGAVAAADLPARCVAVGVPARPVSPREG